MNGFIKRMMAAAAAVIMIAAFAGCAGKLSAPNENNKATESANPMESGSPQPSASAPAESALPSQMPSADPSAESSAEPGDMTDMIEGFMEGVVVDPESVPELIALLAANSDYKDMNVQSITYKLFEGRQAYYVILQGEGEASHPVYVFADNSIVDE